MLPPVDCDSWVILDPDACTKESTDNCDVCHICGISFEDSQYHSEDHLDSKLCSLWNRLRDMDESEGFCHVVTHEESMKTLHNPDRLDEDHLTLKDDQVQGVSDQKAVREITREHQLSEITPFISPEIDAPTSAVHSNTSNIGHQLVENMIATLDVTVPHQGELSNSSLLLCEGRASWQPQISPQAFSPVESESGMKFSSLPSTSAISIHGSDSGTIIPPANKPNHTTVINSGASGCLTGPEHSSPVSSSFNTTGRFLKSTFMHSAHALSDSDLVPMDVPNNHFVAGQTLKVQYSPTLPDTNVTSRTNMTMDLSPEKSSDCIAAEKPTVVEEFVRPRPLPKCVVEACSYNF